MSVCVGVYVCVGGWAVPALGSLLEYCGLHGDGLIFRHYAGTWVVLSVFFVQNHSIPYYLLILVPTTVKQSCQVPLYILNTRPSCPWRFNPNWTWAFGNGMGFARLGFHKAWSAWWQYTGPKTNLVTISFEEPVWGRESRRGEQVRNKTKQTARPDQIISLISSNQWIKKMSRVIIDCVGVFNSKLIGLQ